MQGIRNESALINMFAIVVSDKVPGTQTVNAHPIESLSNYEEELDKVMNIQGIATDNTVSTVEKRLYITADKWFDISGTGSLSPDVKRGELILLWRVRGTEEYSWSGYVAQNDLRGKETMLKTLGNTDKFGEVLSGENSHFINHNPITKTIQMHTANNDGEAVSFDILVDYGKGYVSVYDSNNNSFIHDGKKSTLTAKYATSVTILSKVIILKASTIRLLGDTFIDGALTVSKTISDILGSLTKHSHPPR